MPTLTLELSEPILIPWKPFHPLKDGVRTPQPTLAMQELGVDDVEPWSAELVLRDVVEA